VTGRVAPGRQDENGLATEIGVPAAPDPPGPAGLSGSLAPTEVSRRSRWWRVLRTAVAGAFALFIVVIVASQWREVRPLLSELSVPAVLAAAVAVLAGIFGTFLCWRAILTALGSTPPVSGGMRIFFVGQLAKYVPGAIWPAVTQMQLGRAYQVPPRASGAAVVIFLLTIFGTGLVVAVPTLPLLSSDLPAAYWLTLAVLPLAVVALLPPITNRLIGLALRLTRRPPLPQPMTLAGVLRSAGWSVVAWVAYGVQAVILVEALGTPADGRLFAILTGAFAAAFCLQFMLPFGPAGAGVREGALILLLAATVPRPQATVFAVVSRLLFTLGDVAWSVAALLLDRRRQQLSSAGSPRSSSRGKAS